MEDGEHEDLRPGGGGQPGVGAAAGVQQLHPHPHLGQPLLTPHAHQAGSQVFSFLNVTGNISFLNGELSPYTVKKVSDFPSPAWMSLTIVTKLSKKFIPRQREFGQ